MIREMRYGISFSAATSAANTSHLVPSTLQAANAAQAGNRILDFFQTDEREQIRRQLASTLRAVICQRMGNNVTGTMSPAVEILINTSTVRKLMEEHRLEKLPGANESGTAYAMSNFNQSL